MVWHTTVTGLQFICMVVAIVSGIMGVLALIGATDMRDKGVAKLGTALLGVTLTMAIAAAFLAGWSEALK